MLVPEIALTPAVAGQFHARFGDLVAILHSAFSGSERAGQWRRIRQGAARVVVATRSGVFAPVRNIGLIVVDEEHDASYSRKKPRAITAATSLSCAPGGGWRLRCTGLGHSQSREPLQRTRGKYTLLELPDRIADRPMPAVRVVDMRQEFFDTAGTLLSRALIEAIQGNLSPIMNRPWSCSIAAASTPQ